MSKRKILALASAVCMVAILAIGGTLAYFTDKDEAKNTFTTGKVDITLNEKFDADNAKLLPGSQTANAVEKEVSIKVNSGSEDAYVWYEWLIPAALDSIDGSTGTNNVVHVNSLGRTWDKYRENSKFWVVGQTEALPLKQTWDHDPEVELKEGVGPEGFVGKEKIGDIEYNKYVVLYHGVVGAGEETSVAMSQVYLDSKVDTAVDDDGNLFYTINGDKINYDFSQNIDIIVRAYGIQANGLADVYAAYKAYNAQK